MQLTNRQLARSGTTGFPRWAPLLGCVVILGLGPGPAASAQYCTGKSYGTGSLFRSGERLVDGDGDVLDPRISADGSLRVFHSDASNYVGDSPGVVDVFYAPSYSAKAYRVTAAPNGDPADGNSFFADVSGNGEWITFASQATNLVPGDINGFTDIFLYEVATATMTRISLGMGGAEADDGSNRPTISEDGRYIAFQSRASNLVAGDTNNATDVFRYDRVADTMIRISIDSSDVEGNGDSTDAAIDGSGDLVAFQSLATNLQPGPDNNNASDVFLRRVGAGVTRRISTALGGGDADGPSTLPAISRSGEFLSYTSRATDLIGSDTNGRADIFREDLPQNTRRRVSVGAGGVQADEDSHRSSVADDGAVAFSSDATNLVGGNDQNGVTDIFVRVPVAAITYRASVDSNGAEADALSLAPDLTAAGCDVVFASPAKNLIADRPLETNSIADLFCHRHTGPWPILCTTPELQDINLGVELRADSGPPSGLLALFTTHVNDVPYFQLLFFAPYDGSGHWSQTFTLPNDPNLRGTVPSLLTFSIPLGGGAPRISNPAFVGIQD